MTDQLLSLATTQFSTLLEMLLQQEQSVLRETVTVGTYVGKQASPVNQIGAVEFRGTGGEFQPITLQNPAVARRWVFPIFKDCGVGIDNIDKLQTMIDPQSEEARAVMAAFNRAVDDEIVRAAHASATLGVDASGFTTESWSTSYDIADTFGAGSTSVGLTTDKFIEARRLFRHAHVDVEREPLTMVVGSTQESDLLKQVQITSSEFTPSYKLEDGTVTKFLKFNIKYSERLAYASSIRSGIAFARSGMHLGIWKDMNIDISIRKDLTSHPIQLYAYVGYGATRTQLGKVLKVKCADTVTGDNYP